jgi:hypothetical protein
MIVVCLLVSYRDCGGILIVMISWLHPFLDCCDSYLNYRVLLP